MSQARLAALERPVPALGGFKLAIVALEVRRLLRNRRTVIFSVVMPVIFFLIFGLNRAYAADRFGVGNVSAQIMVSMALYGAVLANSNGGAVVSVERLSGWSRQLRITPLAPVAYVAIKTVTSMTLGLAAVVAVYVAGVVSHKPSMPLGCWAATAALVWVGSILFAAFGLFVGYLIPSENVAQLIGFALLLFSFGGGLFIPLSQFSHPFRVLASYTPLYGLNQLVHYPLGRGAFDWTWLANLAVWLAAFTSGAALLFRRDTARH